MCEKRMDLGEKCIKGRKEGNKEWEQLRDAPVTQGSLCKGRGKLLGRVCICMVIVTLRGFCGLLTRNV